MFRAAVIYDHGTQKEDGYDEEFATEAEALAMLKHWSAGKDACRIWLNGVELYARTLRPVYEPQRMAVTEAE